MHILQISNHANSSNTVAKAITSNNEGELLHLVSLIREDKDMLTAHVKINHSYNNVNV